MRQVFINTCIFSGLCLAQTTQPLTVQVTEVNNITSSATVIDNRSTFTAKNTIHTFCGSGTGAWSATIQYSDTASTGPWTNFSDASASISNSSTLATCGSSLGAVGGGTGYHAFLRFNISGTVSVSYTGQKTLWLPFPIPTGTFNFGGLTSGTNTTATMIVGTGATLTPSGLGEINANYLNGVLLSGLSTGLVKLTAGVPSIASAGTDYISSVSGTSRQITSTASGGAVTISLPNNILFPGTPSFTPSTTGGASLNISSGVAPTSPNAGDFWNLSSVIQYYTGSATASIINDQGSYANPSWITSLAWSKISGPPTFLVASNNLSDVGSASTSRTNLGLGTAAVQATSFFLQTANNLSDLASAPTARTNLGLGTAAVQNNSFFLQSASNLSDLVSATTARTNLGISQANISALWIGTGCGTTTNSLLVNGNCGGGAGTVTNVATSCGATGGPITGSGTISVQEIVNSQSGTSYTVLSSDCQKLVTFNNSSAVAVSLPSVGGSFASGFKFSVKNYGAGSVTITPVSGTIGNAATLVLATGQGADITANPASNWDTQGGNGTGGGSSITMFQQLGDFALTIVGSAVTVCANCSSSTPGIIGWDSLGQAVNGTSLTTPVTATAVGSSADTWYFSVAYPNSIIVTVSGTAPTCSGCTTASGVTFPPNNALIGYCSVNSSGVPTSCISSRAFLHGPAQLNQGTNVTISQSGNQTTFNANSSGGGYSPIDHTVLSENAMLQFTAGSLTSFWGFQSGACAGIGIYTTGVSAGEPAANENAVNTNTFCAYFAPYVGSATGFPIHDFASGSTPLTWTLYTDFAAANQNQNYYVGLSQASGTGNTATTVANYAGIRYNQSNSHFECVIRASGSDVTAANMGVSYSANMARWQVTNGGTANSVTCQVGATAATTITGTIPAGTWFMISGADWTSGTGSAPDFAIGEARLYITGRSATN